MANSYVEREKKGQGSVRNAQGKSFCAESERLHTSNLGPIIRQGPHHVAVKSMATCCDGAKEGKGEGQVSMRLAKGKVVKK